MPLLRILFAHIIDILFPVRCVGCRTDGAWLCDACAEKIRLNETQYCPHCWGASAGGRTCAACHDVTPLDGLRVAASYEKNPIISRAIRTLKYHFSESLADTLSDLLARVVHETTYDGTRIITFVPLHPRRENWRGFNQAELLARSVAKRLHLPIDVLVIRTRETAQQAKLDRAGRLRNLDGAFAITPNIDVKNKIIIVVDDVASTGTTIAECARVLKHAGAREVWGLVVARG